MGGCGLRLDPPQPGVKRNRERRAAKRNGQKRERTLGAPEWGPSVRSRCVAEVKGWLNPVRGARAGAVGDDGGHAGEAFAGFGDFVDAFAAGVPAGDHEGDGDEGDQEGQG